jgi:hypothetical protein
MEVFGTAPLPFFQLHFSSVLLNTSAPRTPLHEKDGVGDQLHVQFSEICTPTWSSGIITYLTIH